MAKFLRPLIFACTVLAVHSLAQEDLPPGVVAVDFTVYAFNDSPVQLRYAVGKGSSPDLQFFPTSRSPHYRYVGPAHLIFYRETSTPGANGQPVVHRQSVAEVQLNPAIRKPLLVFFPLKQPTAAGVEFSVFEYDDSLENLPAGHMAIFNATEYQLALTVAKKPLILDPGPSASFPAKGQTKVTGALVIAGVKYPGAIEDLFPGNPDERGLLFLYPPLRRGSPILQYAYLVEPVVRPEKKTKAGAP